MKTIGWTLMIIGFLIMAMLLLTIFSQTDLLQTRARQGIGTQVGEEELLR